LGDVYEFYEDWDKILSLKEMSAADRAFYTGKLKDKYGKKAFDTYMNKDTSIIEKWAKQAPGTISTKVKQLEELIDDLVGYYDELDQFDTGGYTGSWGSSSGKLAMVHEKELILDPADTTNFLASMDLLHSIISMIDVQAASA
jgi:hypothetical protein